MTLETQYKYRNYPNLQRDKGTGLYYYRPRYYAAWLCRFVSVDPLQHKYPHYTPYQYAGNKPVSYIDLDGLEETFPPSFFEKFSRDLAKETVLKSQTPKKSNTSQNPAVADATNRVNTYKDKAESAYSELNKPKSYWETKMPGVSQSQKDPGSISTLESDPFADFEMWLDTPSKSAGEATKKIGYNILYSMVNSPYSLLTGYTISGHKLNSIEKTDAFVDFAPGLISFGFTKTKSVVKVTKEGFLGFSKPIKSFEGYNKLIKELPELTTTSGLPQGMKWQTRAGQVYQWNKINLQGLNTFKHSRTSMSITNATKDELE